MIGRADDAGVWVRRIGTLGARTADKERACGIECAPRAQTVAEALRRFEGGRLVIEPAAGGTPIGIDLDADDGALLRAVIEAASAVTPTWAALALALDLPRPAADPAPSAVRRLTEVELAAVLARNRDVDR